MARNSLQKKLDEEKNLSGSDFELFSGDAVSFTGEIYSIVSGQKPGDFAEEIELK